MSTFRPLTDLELLAMRADAVGDRVAGLRGVRLLRTRAAEAFDVGSAVPPDLAQAIETAYRLAAPANDPTAALHRSDRPTPAWMRDANPGNWPPIEWGELLDGHLGPWAMATRGRRILSICHTPVRLTVRSAECGVWTHPDVRGRGHAAAVTAAWAGLLRPSHRHLFYSTSPDNRSSHRVTRRLDLRLLGLHWQLSEPSALVRPYEDPDLDVLMAVWRRASAVAHPFQTTAELDRDEALIRARYLPRTETWCAFVDERLVGFLSLVGTRIVALFVDPPEHRKGVGARLLAHANARHGPLTVEVFASNRIAMPFYRRHDFTFAREEPNPLYPDHPQWLMAQPGADLDGA
jgi:GNAT superfamily N-acetyltransferase